MTCQLERNLNSCKITQITFPTKGAREVKCVRQKNGEAERIAVNLISTCGPFQFDKQSDVVSVRAGDDNPFIYQCPLPNTKGVPLPTNHFIYSWYKSDVDRENYIHGNRRLHYDTTVLPVRYLCVLRNKYTNRTATFILEIIKHTDDDQKSILWVAVPAFLIVITVPLIYLAYLKSVGDFDFGAMCKERIFDDEEVDYMITQTGADSSDSSRHTSKKKKAGRYFKNALQRVSNAMERVSSSMSLSTSVIVSLPMTENLAKIKESKNYRSKRACLLKDMNISPLFKRQSRKIRKQGIKDYGDDADASWVVEGIKKVERWQEKIKTKKIPLENVDSVEETLDFGIGMKSYSERMADKAMQLTTSLVPCTVEDWLNEHRFQQSQTNAFPKDTFGHEEDIIEMSNRLVEIYMIAKPHKTYFPTVRKINDPFLSILIDPRHPSYRITKVMWDEYMDRMFTIASDVGTFNKLCKKVLERTLHTYGNPEKIARRTSER